MTKFEASAKIAGMLAGALDSIEGRISFQRTIDVPIAWCDGHLKFHKKGLVYIHHEEIRKVEYE